MWVEFPSSPTQIFSSEQLAVVSCSVNMTLQFCKVTGDLQQIPAFYLWESILATVPKDFWSLYGDVNKQSTRRQKNLVLGSIRNAYPAKGVSQLYTVYQIAWNLDVKWGKSQVLLWMIKISRPMWSLAFSYGAVGSVNEDQCNYNSCLAICLK